MPKLSKLTGPRTRFALILLGALAVTALAGCTQGDESSTTGSDDDPEHQAITFQRTMQDNKFDIPTVTASAGQEVHILLGNNGDNPHTFTIEALGVDSGIIEPGGGTADITFTYPDEPMTFICTVHPEEMQGTLELE